MSIHELWELQGEISKLLEAKMLAEKKIREGRLSSLRLANTELKTRRPSPPEVPKFANPDEPFNARAFAGRRRSPKPIKKQASHAKQSFILALDNVISTVRWQVASSFLLSRPSLETAPISNACMR